MEIPHEFFLNTSGNSTTFLIDPWNFHMHFLQLYNPGNLLELLFNTGKNNDFTFSQL